MSDSVKFFEENKYLKIDNVIDQNVCILLYEHIKDQATRLCLLENNDLDYESEYHGTFEDAQAPGDYSKYGDPICDTLLKLIMPEVSRLIGKKLVPTYSYHRLYTFESELVRHKDRKSCDFSMTLCLGYNNENIQNGESYNWPMFILDKNGKDVPIYMKPGEAVIYRGCDVIHWREPLKALNHAQVFLHYNEDDGVNEKKYDDRFYLGLPTKFRPNKD